MGTVRFGNDHFAAITGYGDYVQGNLTICHVYYVEGLGHYLFSVGQFCDGDLELTFRLNTCYVQNLEAEAIATACFTQNRSLVYTWYNKTLYELIKGRKPNVQYFYVFGSLCYPINDRDELGKMKPKADIGIFIGYSESTRGICSNFQDSSKDSNAILSKEDVDNLFGPLYEEYNATRSQQVSDNSAANTLDKEDIPSSSLIVVEENEAPCWKHKKCRSLPSCNRC
ncbi:retrovirus-related pol polyprotein from transposon TNT 1-94 [Tanacetum coccineum]